MKQKSLLKTLFLLLCALVAGSGSAWGDTTIEFVAGSDKGATSVTKDGVTITMSTMSRDDNYRTYANSDMVVSCESNITSIVVTCTATGSNNYGPGNFSAEGYTFSGYTGTWTGEAQTVRLAASAQVRMTEIVVTISTAPSVRTSTSSLEFGTIKANDHKEMTFDLTPLNLTKNLTLTSTNPIYTLGVNEIAANATKTTVTVTASPTSINNNTVGQIIISCEDLEEDIKIGLSAKIERNDANISFDPVSITLTQGDGLTSQPFKNPKNLTGITFTSSYNNVASVSNSGVITLGNSTGTAIIKATIAQSDVYNAGEATCTITVNPAGVTPEPSAYSYYDKVTSKDQLEDGAHYLIISKLSSGAEYMAMGTFSSSYMSAVDITLSNGIITNKGDAVEVVLKSSGNNWKLQIGDKYYYTSAARRMSLDDTGTEATIDFDNDGNVEITFGAKGSLQYNSNTPRFLNYTSTQKAIQLYKFVPASNPDNIDIYVSAAGLATYASNFDLDYTNVSGLEAYIAKSGENSTITLEQVNKVPAGTGVLLRATAGGTSFNVPVASGTMDNVEDNLFVRGTGATVASEVTVNSATKYNYILNVVDNKLGFYKANNQMVATNRAYLQTSVAAEARVDINFGENSGIVTVSREATASNRYYDLQGRSVMQPAKGLYIVNGKKVVVK